MIIRTTDFALRFMVAEVRHVFDDGSVSVANEREYRTRAAADKRLNDLADSGKVGLLQVGVIEWMNDDKASDRLQRYQKEGATWR